MGLAQRFAFARPKAFPILGWGGVEDWRNLLTQAPVALSRAPHDADLMVLSGEIPLPWGPRVQALFETFALPRLALWVRPTWDCDPPPVTPLGGIIAPNRTAATDWPKIIHKLLAHRNPSHQPLLPDEPPAPWRGQGDYGQGGEGMMGGKPYGRPMAMTMEDGDNLALDDVHTYLGPHFPGLPSGLRLSLKVQGDRIRSCEGVENCFPERILSPDLIADGDPSWRALAGKAVTICELEWARLRNHLGWMGDFLGFAGLEGFGQRFWRLRKRQDPKLIRSLLRRAESRTLRRLTRGTGVITRAQAEASNLTGPVARASGIAVDTRNADPAYQALGFEPQVETAGNIWARCQVRVRECRQSLEMLEKAGDRASQVSEGPRGSLVRDAEGYLIAPTKANLSVSVPSLGGLEWFQAILFIASLDLDMEEAALQWAHR